MKFLIVPGIPLFAIATAIDTRIANVPEPILTAIRYTPFAIGIFVIVLITMRLARS